jgi:DNA-binding beta-propeller fold protein YncE
MSLRSASRIHFEPGRFLGLAMGIFPGIVLGAALGGASAAPAITSGPTATPAAAFVGEDIRFSVEAEDDAGLPLTYRWRFGDSSAGTEPGPAKDMVYRYGAVGHYRANVLVRNTLGEYAQAFLPVTVTTRPTPVAPTASSPIILDTARGRIWCVNPDHGSVSALALATKSLLFEIRTGVNPQTLALAKDGSVWVANRGSGTVSILSGADGAVLKTLALPYGSRPHGLVFNPAGTAAYVSLDGSGRLLRLDPISRALVGEVALGPTPRGLAVSGDGKRILVTRFLSPADHAEVWEVSAEPFARVRTFRLAPDPSVDTETGGAGVLNYLQAIAISPDGRRAAIPAAKANTSRGRRLSGVDLIAENTVRSALAYLDLERNTEDPADRIDFDNSALPSCAAYSPSGDVLFACLEGTNAVHARDPLNNGAPMDRNKDVGAAPIGVALDPRSETLYVLAFLGRTVSAWDVSVYDDPSAILLDSGVARPLGVIPTVRGEALSTEVLKGKRLFYDASTSAMSFNGYISCAVCHLDGATDGRVWDFTDRGEGLRRTTSLLGRAGMGHGPVHWSANFDEIQDFENDIRGPFGGTGLMDDAHFLSGTRAKTLGDAKAGRSPDLDALAAYVSSLTQVNPSPYRNPDGTLTADGAAGKALFESAQTGCARCHAGPQFTDSRLPGPLARRAAGGAGPLPGDFTTAEGFLVHDVGTLTPASGRRLGDTLRGIDTPTLKGLWETAPYFHDGSAATLADVLGPRNSGDVHGRTSHLSAREKEQLMAFLLQLDDGPLHTPVVGIRPDPVLTRNPARLALSSTGAVLRLPLSWRGARVALYDLRGRRVDAPFRDRPASGDVLEWAWDGRSTGAPLARGLYTLRIRAAGSSAELAMPLAWSH